MFCIVLAGLLSSTMAYHVHRVQPDDKICAQLPCPTLQNILDNSHAYFKSYTTFLFVAGEYYHIRTDLMIQNVINISLIGTPNTSDPTSPVSIIRCLPEHSIYFYNVNNLLIKGLTFKGCGNDAPRFTKPLYDNTQLHHWASILISHCTNIMLTNVLLYNPVGYGISGLNVKGKSLIENATIIMERYNLHNFNLFTCSYGVHWWYEDGFNIDKENIYLQIRSTTLKQNYSTTDVCSSIETVIIQILLHQCYHDVHIIIADTRFYKLKGKILRIDVTSLSYNSIYFYNSSFDLNKVSHAIDVQYNFPRVAKTCCPRFRVTFDKITFSHMQALENTHNNNSILRFAITSNFKRLMNLSIVFNNTRFKENFLALLEVFSNIPAVNNQFSVIVTIAEHCIIRNNYYFNRRLHHLISLTNGKMYFNGITKFQGNNAAAIIYSSSSMLSFSNSTVFTYNKCDELLHLNCQLCYLELLGRATLIIDYNIVNSQVIQSSIRYNNPYPYCLFQYFTSNDGQYNNFKILLRTLNSDKTIFEIVKLTSHCRWVIGAAFQNTKPLVVNRAIIHYNDTLHPLGTHHTVCYCRTSSSYNCTADQLGPVHPGENLTVDLCLPYNAEDIGVMYAETYNENLPESACKLVDYDSVKHVFRKKQSKCIQFAIGTGQVTGCELFLTAQPYLYTSYDVFYVHLLPCPLGFTLQHGICGCDPDLRKYIDDCMISSQTVRKFDGVYILGTTSDNSTNTYIISIGCPTDYCLTGTKRIDLYYTDLQCQPHRTGLLCSQCVEGYSVVFGSNQCKKCSNAHLLFILFILLTGPLLILILFCLNLTVTSGTINGIILYVNIIQINRSIFQLKNRLVMALSTYVSIFYLSSLFEMCFYKGMNMYIKKWIQLAYPIYLIVIAVLFILGSRYSNKLYRLTHKRALPVLATLLILMYTSMLQAIASAPLYTTIISIPGHSSKNLWLLDPTIPLFGWKSSLLICVCLLLFLFLLMFNAVLLFTKSLMRFKCIHRFKPLIDAIQGPFKSQHYYWIGIQLLIRNIIVLLSVFDKTINMLTSCIIITYITIIQSYVQPYKSVIINIQELLLLSNFSTLCIFLIFDNSEALNVITVNALVGLSFIHSLLILLYHIFMFVGPCRRILNAANVVWRFFFNKLSCCRRQAHQVVEYPGIEIPDVDLNFANFREPLIGED